MTGNKHSILAVDDSVTTLKMINEICKGIYKVYSAPSGNHALTFLEKIIPDIILLDIEMPVMDGFEVISRIKSMPSYEHIPVIFLTASEGREVEELAFKSGAVDFILKPVSAGVLLARLSLHLELVSYKENLEDMVMAKTLKIERTQDSILDILANVTNYRDNDTGGHIIRTTSYVQKIIERLIKSEIPGYALSEEYAANIIKAAKLHDIGKVAIPDKILLKPGKLEPNEFEVIKMHTIIGSQMIDQAIVDLGDDSPLLTVAKEIVVSHHERWDGNGYPLRLFGDKIPLSARIMAISDVYDALLSPRPYKSSIPHNEVIEIIMKNSQGHFDPNIIELCTDIIEDFEEIALSITD